MNDCVTNSDGTTCLPPSDWKTCRPWDMTQDDAMSCYVDDLTQEALSIAGAQVNVHKLLGVHEQTKLVDLTGDGQAISGGDHQTYPRANAFTTFSTEWRSMQSGAAAISASAYIGYDFGVVKLPNGRNRYGIEAPHRHQITAIKIKQSSMPTRRVSKVRVERSDNGVEWYGVAVLTLPNDDQLNTLHFKHSAPMRYWRIRPIGFVGMDCDRWGVAALEMYDYSATHLSNIQDKILMENRDRDYATTPTPLKGYYELLSTSTDLSRFGIEIPTATYQIRINFNACVAALGRPIVIGDIVELPSETQYTPDLQPVKRWLEVTDVTWDSTSYTPGWRPTLLMVTGQPALATQETQDIFGDLSKIVDTSGLFDKGDGNSQTYQDFSSVDQTISADAKTQVPQRGSEGSNTIRAFESSELTQAAENGIPTLNRLGLSPRSLHVEDAMPQNGAEYTEGATLPTTAANGAYHRLTYTGLAKDVPARLFRWSAAKNRWIYLETDRRTQFNNQKAVLEEYTTSAQKRWATEVR